MEAAQSATRAATVAVLRGGRSGEREISLASGAAVAAALRDAADGRGPARVVEVEITACGAWRLGGEDHAPEEALARIPREALFFLALHGGEGEDGTIQGLLAACGRTWTGSGVAASALCLTKSWTRSVLADAGLSVAPGRTVDQAAWRADRASVLASCRALAPRGHAVKPDRGGSSVATFVLDDPERLAGAIEAVLATGDRALVEARVEGVECTVGVLGHGHSPRALTPVEIVPKDGRFFDYEEKYSASGASELCPPRTLDAAACARLGALATRAYRAAGCEGYARIDFIAPAGGRDPVVLEINTLPGMTSRSLLPLAAAEAGLSFRSLCLAILDLALERVEPAR